MSPTDITLRVSGYGFIHVLTQQILFRELHLQLLWIQYNVGKLVAQYQVR